MGLDISQNQDNDQGKIQCFMVEAKHLIIKFHCIREHVKNNKIILEFYKLEDQIAYIFTKSLNKYVFFFSFFLGQTMKYPKWVHVHKKCTFKSYHTQTNHHTSQE